MTPDRPPLMLSPTQARVIAVLIEKERTVPDTYPLTLNTLLAGCNQKTSRDPVMNLSEADALEALDALKRRSLIIESSGSRVMRYSQNFRAVVGVPTEAVALLATLMLRGPQTAAELRMNCERLHRFSDISATEGFLAELAQRPGGALVVELPRQPGARENRWAHLLSGPVATAASGANSGAAAAANLQQATPMQDGEPPLEQITQLRIELGELRGELATVRAELAALYAELGIAR